MLLAQVAAELRMRARVPAFSVTTLALPVVFFMFFGLPVAALRAADGSSIGARVLVSFGAFAVGSVMVFSFGVGVAGERAMRTDVLMRATPLPPPIHVLAKLLTALVFALAALVLLIAFGTVVGGVREPPGVWIDVVVRLLAGSLPFVGLGFWIGYVSSPQAAPAVANLIYLPLSFASGLFVPLDQLPGFIRTLAPFLPSYHYARLAWSAVATHPYDIGQSLVWVAAYSLALFALAIRAYRREEQLKFA
jgi:ABC-2 type transport system permease protein